LLDAHQPQVALAVQSPQLALTLHGSLPMQLDGTKSQLAHMPIAGPVAPPVLQVLSDAHQPQLARNVQSPHAADVPHGSLPQLSELHSQFVHAPTAGPAAVPE
jgi:hypothetical protein